jgi:hypothetical protein
MTQIDWTERAKNILAQQEITPMVLELTLNQINACDPYPDGWKKLVRGLGTDFPRDKKFNIWRILETNNWNDMCWAFRVFAGQPEIEKQMRLAAADCAELVQCLMPEDQLEQHKQILTTIRAYARGEATDAARAAAREEAMETPWDAPWAAAWDAANEAPWEAVREAAREAARTVARAAVREAARAATMEAARAAPWDVPWDAVWTAAWDAASQAPQILIAARFLKGGAA